jgi:hypothetical protein
MRLSHYIGEICRMWQDPESSLFAPADRIRTLNYSTNICYRFSASCVCSEPISHMAILANRFRNCVRFPCTKVSIVNLSKSPSLHLGKFARSQVFVP